MPNHKSAEKRVRQSAVRRLRNRYQLSTCRAAIKKLKKTTNKQEALSLLPKIYGMLDKLAKRRVIHKNKSANLKSKITRWVNAMPNA
ncbi:MAG: 30S ribosomal protein S20 [Bacteroidia bacterium]|nr:30S ribosomal protein S20 [Bacteroidia bacterium]MDW8346158.1 30S ribosomal protein S20 [Bacteroidia bacterium]